MIRTQFSYRMFRSHQLLEQKLLRVLQIINIILDITCFKKYQLQASNCINSRSGFIHNRRILHVYTSRAVKFRYHSLKKEQFCVNLTDSSLADEIRNLSSVKTQTYWHVPRLLAPIVPQNSIVWTPPVSLFHILIWRT